MVLGNSEEQTNKQIRYSFNNIQAPWSTYNKRIQYLQDSNNDNSKTIYIEDLVHLDGRWLQTAIAITQRILI